MASGSRRLFFALWLQSAQAAALQRYARTLEPLAGRLSCLEDLHVTLCFLGNVQDSVLEALLRCAGGVRAAGFELLLDRVEFWRRSRVLAATCTRTPPAAHRLVADLRGCAGSTGAILEARAFQPHVTLIRALATPSDGLPGSIRIPTPFKLHAQRFYLAESQSLEAATAGTATTARYRCLQEWPLLGPDGGSGL